MNRRFLLHLGFWLAYALYDGYLSVPLSGTTFADLSIWERLSMGYRAELLLLLIKIPAVYLVLYRLLPPSFENKKFLRLGLQFLFTAAVATLAIYAVWHKVIYPHIYHIDPPTAAANAWVAAFRLLWSSFDIMMLLSVASALRLFRMRLSMAEREKQLVEEKLQSELRFLRAQTNPHFLFNTLNNLYHLARKRSDSTPDAILKLSGMMRFMLYECAAPRIRLSQEVNVIRDYLDLERLRYGSRLDVVFQVDTDDESRLIAPLLLLPFVENAFKHGASESQGATWVRIFLLLKQDELSLRVENAKDPSEKMTAPLSLPAKSRGRFSKGEELQDSSHLGQPVPNLIREGREGAGIGLKNVKRQLELLYPDHSLRLDDEGAQFSVRLQIDLSNESKQP